jgi:hypothetical protein
MTDPGVTLLEATAPGDCMGLAALSRLAFHGGDLQPVFAALLARTQADPSDAASWMDIATLLLLSGDRPNGLAVQAQALSIRAIYQRAGAPGGLRVLAIMAPGDTMANTPLDFLLEGSGASLISLYAGPGGQLPGHVPDHDVAFLAVGESEDNRPLLLGLKARLRRWPRPLLNADPARIAALTRDGVCALLAGARDIFAPAAHRLDREAMERIGRGDIPFDHVLTGGYFPIIVRPIGSHAGTGLQKLVSASEFIPYLATQTGDRFYVSPFIDYSNDDGLFRKQRIALIEGRPYVCHLAVSPRWMVHYLNAEMLDNAHNRAEEAQFMADFDDDFARRHAAAFADLHTRIGLDYFAIDCAETRDGKLLLFEADVAMIVHAMDSPDLFPYKPPQMAKVFAAFLAMLRRAAAR